MTRNGDTGNEQGQVSIWRSNGSTDALDGPAGTWLQGEIRVELDAAIQTFPEHPLFVRLVPQADGEDQVLAPARSACLDRVATAIARLSPMQREVVMRSLRYTDFNADVLLARDWSVTPQSVRSCRERTLRRLAALVRPPL